MKPKIIILFVLVLATIGFAFQLMSVTLIDSFSNYPPIAGKVWVITLSAAGATDKLAFSTSPQQIDTYTLDSSTIKNSFTLDITGTKNQLRSYITTDNSKRQVFTIYSAYRKCWFYETGGANACIENWFKNTCNVAGNGGGRLGAYDYNDPIANEGRCPVIKSTLGGAIGTISAPDNLFSADFKLNVPNCQSSTGCTETKVVSNINSLGGSTKIGDHTYVEWLGNLVSGKAVQQPSGVIALYSSATSTWKIVDRSYYENTYLPKLNNQGELDQCYVNALNGITTPDRCELAFNDVANAVTNDDTTDIYLTQGNTKSVSGGLSSGTITFDFNQPLIQIPQFRLILDSSIQWVGLIKPTGSPELVSVNFAGTFREGQLGQIQITAKNKGSAEGAFEILTSCSASTPGTSFTPDPTVYSISSLGAGQTTSVNIAISGVSTALDATAIGSCKVTMKEKTTQEQVSKDVQISMTQIFTCQQGETVCIGNSLYECNNERTAVNKVREDCVATGKYCTATGGPARCESPTTNCATLGTKPSFGQTCCPGLVLHQTSKTCERPEEGGGFTIDPMLLLAIIGIAGIGVVGYVLVRRSDEK